MRSCSREKLEGQTKILLLLSIEKFGEYKTEVKEIIEERKRQALRNKVKEEKEALNPFTTGNPFWGQN